MSLIYIHGVNVRDPQHGIQLEKPFRRWVMPKLQVTEAPSLQPEYLPVFWGGKAAKFRWDLASRPPTPLLRAGGAAPYDGVGSLRSVAASQSSEWEPVSGPVLGQEPSTPPTGAVPLDQIGERDRADFLADLYLAARYPDATDPIATQTMSSPLAAAAADVATRWNEITARSDDAAEQAANLLREVDDVLTGRAASGLQHQGGLPDWLSGVEELLSRAVRLPANATSTLLAEGVRPGLNNLAARFLGDILVYQNTRVDAAGAPGAIPNLVLDALRRAHKRKCDTGEPIVILSHSMGGQLVYDALTYFAPADQELKDLKVECWFTCGSQVSFFAELGLFLGQPNIGKPDKLLIPACLSNWINFYDTNDFLAFIMEPVFAGVKDRHYGTGNGLLAHTAYLGRPSFFETLASYLTDDDHASAA